MNLTKHELTYLMYLIQAAAGGLPPDGRRADYPCPRFEKAGRRLLGLGYARRRFWLFGPIQVTLRGAQAVIRSDIEILK